MSKIHYATGGLITPEKAEFSTLCGRKFPTGGSNLMQSGYQGALNTTCKDCRDILDWNEQKRNFFDKLEGVVRKARMDDELAKKLMFAITHLPN